MFLYSSMLRSSRRALATVVFAAALVVGTVAAPAATAAPPVGGQQAAINLASHLSDVLGLASGGFYLDHGKAVVTVLDDASARKVEAAGLTARKVKYSFSALTGVKNALDGLKAVPHTGWGIDPRTNKVVVTIFSAATKSTSDTVLAAAAKYGDRVRVEHKPGKLTPKARGGDSMWSDGGVGCTLGFNVKRNGTPYILTAGHCTSHGGTWSSGNVSGATVVHSNFPGDDFGLLTRPNGTGPGQINTGQQITSAGDAYVGEWFQSQGMTTGNHWGEVTGVDVTIYYPEGAIYHLFATNYATGHGDSGGPAYDGSTGLGILSGGNSTDSYFYPLTRAMNAYGVSLV